MDPSMSPGRHASRASIEGDPSGAVQDSASGAERGKGNGSAAGACGTRGPFVFDASCVQRLDGILRDFIGTHNFHNFTPSALATQMAAQRHIMSCSCKGIVQVSLPGDTKAGGAQGGRWICCEIVGQSFVMNQIRKMIGMAVAVYRGVAPRDAIFRALDPARDFSTPMAPASGLLLVESMFDTYNEVWCRESQRPLLQLKDFEPLVTKFKLEVLYPTFARRECQSHDFRSFVAGITEERYLFSTWHLAAAVRNEKRPRTREERERDKAIYQKRMARIDELVTGGADMATASQVARAEEAALVATETP